MKTRIGIIGCGVVGGACFPKDVNAWVRVCEALQIDPAVSKSAWTKSCELRK